MTYKCVRCGGPIVLGVNGFLNALSVCYDGDPAGAIPDTFRGVHYVADCGDPGKKIPELNLEQPSEE